MISPTTATRGAGIKRSCERGIGTMMSLVLAPATDEAEQFSVTDIDDFSPAIHDLFEARVDDRISDFSAMSVSALACGCMCELSDYRRGEVCDNPYSMELLRRATLHRDPLAWEALQQCLSAAVLRWLRRHPLREHACRFDSEENYVAQAFARFWQASVLHEQLEFRTLAAALRYLHASLNGVVLDTLRTYLRPKELPLPEPGWAGEPLTEDNEDSEELWGIIQYMIPNAREQRVAYLLFHCGLKPREIVRYCSQEFSKVSEIYRLRRNILLRLMRNADNIRWQLAGVR
jgi:hypothetical protein